MIEEEERAPSEYGEGEGEDVGPESQAHSQGQSQAQSQLPDGEEEDEDEPPPQALPRPKEPGPQPLDEGAAAMLGPTANAWKDHVSQMGNVKKYIEESSVTTALYREACGVLKEDEGVSPGHAVDQAARVAGCMPPPCTAQHRETLAADVPYPRCHSRATAPGQTGRGIQAAH